MSPLSSGTKPSSTSCATGIERKAGEESRLASIVMFSDGDDVLHAPTIFNW